MPVSNAPETPRQRLIGLMYILLLCMLALNVSSDVLGGFDLVENSLKKSTENSCSQNKALYKEFDYLYKSNPEKTKEWYKLSQNLKQRSDSLYNYINELKWEVIKEADGKKADINNPQRTDNLDAAANVMLPPSGKKGREFKKMVDDYRDYITSFVSDSLKRQIIEDNFNTEPAKKAKKEGKNWETSLFEDMPMGAVIAIFTKYQNDVRYAEGEILHILMNNIDIGDFRVNQIKAYVIPNAKNVVKGGSYKANIVLSAEDSTKLPKVYVNGEYITPGNNGTIEYKAVKAGTFPVEGYVELQKADGSIQKHKFKDSYTVVEPMATVSNTLMNVLYAGIDNKISISVPGMPANKIAASSNNGQLKRSGYNWIARPKAGKECIITVTADMDGKRQVVARKPFRVRPLPEPRAFIEYKDANGITRRYKGGSMFSKAKLLQIPEIVAALDDNLLEVNFTVLSFQTLIYDSMGNTLMEISSGNKFSERQKQQIRGLRRGKRLWISSIKVVGPDNIEQILSPMEIIIK